MPRNLRQAPCVTRTRWIQAGRRLQVSSQGAAAYAFKYAISHNPNYYSYRGDDCTNFVSQAMKAGGWQETSDWNPNPDPLWPFWGNATTPAWSAVHNFLDFAIRQGKAIFTSWSAAMEGDVIAAWWTPRDTIANHLMVIDAVHGTPAETVEGSIWISQHSTDRQHVPLWGPKYSNTSRGYAWSAYNTEPTYKLLHIK